MAIDATRILSEIEKHTALARKSDPTKMRESIAAIRALCDLLLDDDRPATEKPQAIPLATPQVQTVSSVNKLKEDDANGDSLFEF
ncbi:MAG TPA: YwdI family protein [Planococcus sp. (in: firmicutes)]|nr:YwdI family protein [Planococcus sp. (in: firmicutes)]